MWIKPASKSGEAMLLPNPPPPSPPTRLAAAVAAPPVRASPDPVVRRDYRRACMLARCAHGCSGGGRRTLLGEAVSARLVLFRKAARLRSPRPARRPF